VYPDSYFSEADVDRLLADRNLVVEVGDDGNDRSHLSVIDGDETIGETIADGRRSLYRELAERGDGSPNPSTFDGEAAASSTSPPGEAEPEKRNSEVQSSGAAAVPPVGEVPMEELQRRVRAATLERLHDLLGDPLDFPPVAQLERLVASVNDMSVIRLMSERDPRKTARAIYDDRLAQLDDPGYL
jgi:hypothetical protein